MPAGSVVSVKDLSVTFQTADGTHVPAVDRVSFDVKEGEVVCIVGPSGCGKSTILNVLSDTVRSGPTRKVLIEGSAGLVGLDDRPASRRLGYMFQKDTLLPWMSAIENVALPLRFRKAPERQQTAMQLLKAAGLGSFANALPNALSGGMRKRVQLVQVLAQDPAVILMDEPFGALDAQTKILMQLEFIKAWERDRKSVMFVTHDLHEAILLGDRIICMSARPGRVKLELEVNMPRPRSVESASQDPHALELYRAMWHALREEADAALTNQY